MGLVQFDRGCPVLVWSDMGLSGLGLVRAGGVLLITLHAKEDWQSRQAACPDGSAGLRRRWLPSNSSWLMSPPSSQQHIPCYAVFQTVFLPPLWNTKLTPCTLHFTKRMIRIGIREVVMLASKQRCNFLSRHSLQNLQTYLSQYFQTFGRLKIEIRVFLNLLCPRKISFWYLQEILFHILGLIILNHLGLLTHYGPKFGQFFILGHLDHFAILVSINHYSRYKHHLCYSWPLWPFWFPCWAILQNPFFWEILQTTAGACAGIPTQADEGVRRDLQS